MDRSGYASSWVPVASTSAAPGWQPAQALADNLALVPALSALAGGKLARDTFATLFADSLCALSLAEDNRPAPTFCAAN